MPLIPVLKIVDPDDLTAHAIGDLLQLPLLVANEWDSTTTNRLAVGRRELLDRIGALRHQIHEEIGATALELGGVQ
jgi:hypothetical protein